MKTVFDAEVDAALIDRSLAGTTLGSVWLDTDRPQHPPAAGPTTCDLLVVGGGYTGLWSALHAARRHPDRRVVLIEVESRQRAPAGW